MLLQFAMFSAVLSAASLVSAQQGVQPAAGVQVQVGTPNAPGIGVQTYGSIGPSPWFANPGVRQQLKLNDEQFNQLNRSYRENWNRYHADTTRLGADLNEQQRRERTAELQKNFHQKFNTTRDGVFTDPTARARYNQLYYQYQGYGSLNDPTVRQRLNLTPDQINRINELDRNWQRDMQGMNRNFAADRDAATPRYNDWSRQNRDRLNHVLDKNQQRTWSEVTGDPYDFPAEVYFPAESRNATIR